MKVLLSNINSLWGVIVNPQSSNTYRHIISFDSEQKKVEFINDNLFNGKDFRKLISEEKEIATRNRSIESSTKLNFIVNVEDYKEEKENINETIFRLLNKDFAIVEYSKNKYKYYTLTSERLGVNQILFNADLDIFFTYDIKDMFNNELSLVKRAMTDRFIKVENDIKNILEIDAKFNFEDKKESTDYLSIIYNHEPIDSDINKNLLLSPVDPIVNVGRNIPFDKIRFEEPEHEEDKWTEKEKIESIQNFNAINWGIIFSTDLPENQWYSLTGDYDKSSDSNEILPYGVLVAPTQIPHLHFKEITYYHFETQKKDTIKSFSLDFLKNPKTLKNSHSILQINPLNSGYVKFIKFKKDSYQKISIEIEGFQSVKDNHIIVEYNFSEDPLLSLNYFKTLNEYKSFKKLIFPEYFYNPQLSINDKIKDNDYNTEIKSFFSPYRIFELMGVNNLNKKTFEPQYFKSNNFLTAHGGNTYDMVGSNFWINFIGYNRSYGLKEDTLDINRLIGNNSYTLPTNINAFEEFNARNKNQQNAKLLSNSVNTGLGVGIGLLGILAAPFTGGLSAVAGIGLGAGMISSATRGAMAINQQMAMRRDVKNTPNQVLIGGGNLISDFARKPYEIRLITKTLESKDILKVREFFYKYGYNYNDTFRNLNDLIKSRYYFNYIECSETFENIKGQYSADIKQLINDTLASGLTIWHYRDKKNWKGIKNYDFENLEMGVINV